MLCKERKKLNTSVPWEGYKIFWVQDPTVKPSIILSPQEWGGGRTRNSLPPKTNPRPRMSLAALGRAGKLVFPIPKVQVHRICPILRMNHGI